jgi:hypothetical protein
MLLQRGKPAEFEIDVTISTQPGRRRPEFPRQGLLAEETCGQTKMGRPSRVLSDCQRSFACFLLRDVRHVGEHRPVNRVLLTSEMFGWKMGACILPFLLEAFLPRR